MDEREWLAERFEEHRTRLRAVAHGAAMLVTAWHGQPGWESTVILRRDDQIGCLFFLPADEAEARWTAASRTKRGAANSG